MSSVEILTGNSQRPEKAYIHAEKMIGYIFPFSLAGGRNRTIITSSQSAITRSRFLFVKTPSD
jgi:hypothetical protein